MIRKLRFTPALAAALVLASTHAWAKDTGPVAPAHDDDHHHGEHHATLKLNDGKKWETDAALRKGMDALRERMGKAIEPIHAGKYTDKQYDGLAADLEKTLHQIIADCKLPTDADAQLHILLVDFFGGIQTMKGGEGPRSRGAARFVKALNQYGAYFDHPGWQSLGHH